MAFISRKKYYLAGIVIISISINLLFQNCSQKKFEVLEEYTKAVKNQDKFSEDDEDIDNLFGDDDSQSPEDDEGAIGFKLRSVDSTTQSDGPIEPIRPGCANISALDGVDSYFCFNGNAFYGYTTHSNVKLEKRVQNGKKMLYLTQNGLNRLNNKVGGVSYSKSHSLRFFSPKKLKWYNSTSKIKFAVYPKADLNDKTGDWYVKIWKDNKNITSIYGLKETAWVEANLKSPVEPPPSIFCDGAFNQVSCIRWLSCFTIKDNSCATGVIHMGVAVAQENSSDGLTSVPSGENCGTAAGQVIEQIPTESQQLCKTGTYKQGNSGENYFHWICDNGSEMFKQNCYADKKNNNASTVVVPSLSCPEGYIKFSANDNYKTKAFCVAQYEMKLKYNGVVQTSESFMSGYERDYKYPQDRAKYVAVSVPEGVPWINIERGIDVSSTSEYKRGAVEACQSIGTGYDLISNAQWQTIAQAVELNGYNWTGGTVGSGKMFIGHSDNNPSHSLEANTGQNDYAGTGNSIENALGQGLEQRRTLYTNDNKVIWDFNGNVREWVKDEPQESLGAEKNISLLRDSNEFAGATSPITNLGGLSGTPKFLFGPTKTYDATSTSNFGFGYAFIGVQPNGYMTRGGGIDAGSDYSGIYTVHFGLTGPVTNHKIGFRCVYNP